jgi:hypothetical protein
MELAQDQITDFCGEPSGLMTTLNIFTSFATVTNSGKAL